MLLVVAYGRRERQATQTRWLLVYLVVSVVWELSLYLTPRLGIPIDVAGKLLLAGTAVLGITTSVFLERPRTQRWLIAGALAIATAVAGDLLLPPTEIRLGPVTSSARELIHSALWLAFSTAVFIVTWRDYRRTRFPWHANRVLYWANALLITFIGEALLHLGWSGLTVAGQVVRFIGVTGLAYAIASYRLFDVRTRSQRVLAFLLTTLISALPIVGAFVLIQRLPTSQRQSVNVLLIVSIIVFSLLIYDRFRRLVDRQLTRNLFGERIHPNQVVRDYSRAISNTLDMQQLSLAIINTLSELFRINRGALLLVWYDDHGRHIEPVPALGRIPLKTPADATAVRFYDELQTLHQPLLQYELDFNPRYTGFSSTQKAWFAEMGMEVYVPVLANSRLEGIIAIGPKHTGATFQQGELDLLQVLADQTVVALRNARLYGELGAQNERIRELNVDLIGQNERLEIMDRVKTDFITIASHELRTPLTQVKGYADILTVMNDDGALSQDQTREIMGYINRATGQLERVITALLDASQLDVEGMKMSYVETTLPTIVRMASDPLRSALRERRITLETAGLEEQPPLYADFQRMVQAFSNIIGNAVKYTPDHGHIVVSARQAPAIDPRTDFLEVTISDSGIGIDTQYHDLIFEKFFRIGSTELHSTGGTKFKGAGPGLGLPIARGVIASHHGRIWVESPGEDEERLPGSRFHILLPVDPRVFEENLEVQERDTMPLSNGLPVQRTP